MGTIIAAAAVLEIHMDRNIVVVMKPNIKRLGLWPEGVDTNIIVKDKDEKLFSQK